MDIITLVFNLLIIGLVFTLILFIVKRAPVEEPIKGIIVWVVYVVAALWLIGFLLGMAPPVIHSGSPFTIRR